MINKKQIELWWSVPHCSRKTIREVFPGVVASPAQGRGSQPCRMENTPSLLYEWQAFVFTRTFTGLLSLLFKSESCVNIFYNDNKRIKVDDKLIFFCLLLLPYDLVAATLTTTTPSSPPHPPASQPATRQTPGIFIHQGLRYKPAITPHPGYPNSHCVPGVVVHTITVMGMEL